MITRGDQAKTAKREQKESVREQNQPQAIVGSGKGKLQNEHARTRRIAQ